MQVHGLPIDEMCDKCKHKAPMYMISTCRVYSIEGVKRWKRLGKGCPMNSALVSIDYAQTTKRRVGQQKQSRIR